MFRCIFARVLFYASNYTVPCKKICVKKTPEVGFV